MAQRAQQGLGVTSYWWGSSVSVGYRPYVLGPRPISGPGEMGSRSFPSHRKGGGWGDMFSAMGHVAAGDADGAPGWQTPFDSPYTQQGINSVRATPRADQMKLSGLGASQGEANVPRNWASTLQPLVDPSFVFPQESKGVVKYNNAPFFAFLMRQTPQRKWPLFPNRGTFKGPYGEHELPFYAKLMRTPKEPTTLPWPRMRSNKLGIQAQFLADESRQVLPARGYVHAHRRSYVPRFSPRPDTAWPGGQAWLSRGRSDYFQEPTPRKHIHSGFVGASFVGK